MAMVRSVATSAIGDKMLMGGEKSYNNCIDVELINNETVLATFIDLDTGEIHTLLCENNWNIYI